MSIKQLNDYTKSMLQSSYQINNFQSAVIELIYNSLDAESTAVAVRINLKENQIQVIDNGCGISKDNLEKIGPRNMTNKDNLSDKYGGKGIILSSLIQITSQVEITSRCGDTTWSLCFKNGRRVNLSKANPRASIGTTVNLDGFLDNLPIRKQSLNHIRELKSITKCVKHIALVHEKVSFSLRDNSNFEILLEIHKTPNILAKIDEVFGERVSESLKELHVEKAPYKLVGFIGKQIECAKFGLIYINKRLVDGSRLDEIFEKLLSKAFPRDSRLINKNRHFPKPEITIANDTDFNYLIQLTVPYEEYELIQHANRSHIEFQECKQVEKLFEKFINFFKDSLTSEGDSKEKLQERVAQIVRKVMSSDKMRGIGYTQLQNHVKGRTVKRTKRKSPKNKQKLKTPCQKNLEKDHTKKTNITVSNKAQNSNDCVKNKNEVIFKKPRNDIRKKSKASRLKFDTYFNISNKSVKQRCYEISNELSNVLVKYKKSSGPQRKILMYHSVKTSKDPEKALIKRSGTIIIREFIPFPKKYIKANNTNMKIPKVRSSYDLLKTVINFHERNNRKTMRNIPIQSSYDSHCCESKHLKNQDIQKIKFKTQKIKLKENNVKLQVLRNPKNDSIDISRVLSNVVRENNRFETEKLYDDVKNNTGSECSNVADFNNQHNSKSALTTINFKESKDITYNDLMDVYQSIEKELNEKEETNRTAPNYNKDKDDSCFKYCSNINVNSDSVSGAFDNINKDEFEIVVDNDVNSHCLDKDDFNIIVDNDVNSHCFKNDDFEIIVDNHINSPCLDNTAQNTAEVVSKSTATEFIEDTYVKNDLETVKTIKRNMIVSKSTYHKSTNDNNVPSKFLDSAGNSKEIIFASNENDQCMMNVDNENSLDPLNICETVFEEKTNDDMNLSMFKDTFVYKESPILCNKNIRVNYSNKKFEDGVDTSFAMKSRLEFLPKGQSQLFANDNLIKSINLDLSRNSDNYFTGKIYENFEDNIQKCAEIYEPNFQWEGNNVNRFEVKLKKTLSNVVFDKESLQSAQIINQVDCKFISALMSTIKGRKYLVLLDQHAVHERIRLEKLLEVYKPKSWCPIDCEPIIIAMDRDSLQSLSNLQTKMFELGLLYTVDWTSQCVEVLQVPTCIIGRGTRKADEIKILVQKLIDETLQSLDETSNVLNMYPKTLLDLVNMEACRFAIKFGDRLSYDSLTQLLSELSKCKAPFQCAHGRPSVAVLMPVSSMHQEYKVNPKNIYNFKKYV